MSRPLISIWFFIGVLLGAYGILILGSGIDDLLRPSENPVKLAHLHAGIWWGALLILLGLIYTLKFAPGKTRGVRESRVGRGTKTVPR
jgi:hypothetical protein